jgi:hypothetical protein
VSTGDCRDVWRPVPGREPFLTALERAQEIRMRNGSLRAEARVHLGELLESAADLLDAIGDSARAAETRRRAAEVCRTATRGHEDADRAVAG